MSARPVSLPELAAAVRVVRQAVRDETWTRTPIGAAVARYLSWKKSEWGASRETIRDYQLVLARIAVFHADKRLDQLTRVDLSDALAFYWADRSAGTRAKVVSIIHDFYRWAVDFEVVSEDPSAKIRRPRRQTPDRKMFTPAEVRAILAAASGRDRAAVEILFGLAIRKGALCGIQLGDYDGTHLKIRTKGAKRQVLPIADPWLKAVLDEHWAQRQAEAALADRDWRAEYLLYPARDMPRRRSDGPQADRWEDRLRPLSGTATHMWWGRMIEAAGVPYRGMHSARHTRLTEIVRYGKGGLKLAQILAGHSSIAVTGDIYANLDDSDLEELLRAIAADRSVPEDG